MVVKLYIYYLNELNKELSSMSKSCRNLIGHFRVAFCSCAKTSVIAKLLKSNSIPHTDFFSKGFAKRLVLKQRHKVNRKFVPTGTRLAGKSNSFFQVPVRLLGAECENAAFLQLACTCEKTCESVCAINGTLYPPLTCSN